MFDRLGAGGRLEAAIEQLGYLPGLWALLLQAALGNLKKADV